MSAGESHRRQRAAGARILVGGVGFSNLRDHSVGPLLVPRLQEREWPPGVEVEDLSMGALHVAHWLREQEPPYSAVVVWGAVDRGGPPGEVRRYRWGHVLPEAARIQAAIEEAGTGIISLPTLLIVCEQLRALPRLVEVIEIEPRDHAWGEELSPPVARAVEEVPELIREAVEELSRELG